MSEATLPSVQQAADVCIDDVSDDGLVGRGDGDPVLEVLFGGRPLWWPRFLRDSRPDGTGRLLAWPESLRPHLNGATRLCVREYESKWLLYDREVRLGQGSDRISVVDENGRPLSVTAKGRLKALLSQRGPQVVSTIVDAAEDVLAIMREAGVEGFLAYGSLLGAVRAGQVIPHDYDADLSYLSTREFPVDAIGESYRLERAIRAYGYAIHRYSALAFKVRLDSDDATHPWLDVFGSMIVGDMLYVVWDVGAPMRRDQVLPLGTCRLEGRELPAPRDVDAWLTATYGPSWRVPDPSFVYDTPLSVTRRLSGWFGRLKRGDLQWAALHADVDEQRLADGPSGFATWVAHHEPDADVVVDIGCGVGTDALWYASRPDSPSDRTVLGLDFSTVALDTARARAANVEAAASFRLLNLADLRSVLVTGAVLARLPGRRVLTARFVADALTPAERSNLWLVARMALRGGGRMYLENALPRDSRHRAFADANRLRRLPVPVLRAELKAAGATIHECEPVESPAGAEFPDTMRMVLSWPKRRTSWLSSARAWFRSSRRSSRTGR